MPAFNTVNDRTAIVAIKDSLQTNLVDPKEQWTSADRNWIHTDIPLQNATYPRMQVRKRGPTGQDILSMGQDFVEQKAMILDLQMWSQPKFKWDTGSLVYIQDEELIKEWLQKAWDALKDDQDDLHDTYGITGLKIIDEGEPFYDEDLQLFTGTLSIRIWYFRK